MLSVTAHFQPFNHRTRIMNRAEKFQKIFDSRKESTNKAKAAIEKLTNVQGALESCTNVLRKIADHLKDSPDDERKATATRFLDELERNYFWKIRRVLEDMREIQTRFSRQKLNIGITGNAGIGKSTLLQNLTGLPGDIIPARKRGDENLTGGSCTGAPSIIENNLDNDRTYVDVEFYQETDFFEDILKKYYEAINQRCRLTGKSDWTPCPINFSDFMNNPLLELSPQQFEDTIVRNLYDQLKIRHEHAGEYSRNFGRVIPKLENLSEIRKYVAQQDVNNNPNFEWIPVRIAKIFCPFYNKNGERNMDPFSVCDTPGLGDIGCKADDCLAQNVAENVDAIWMMSIVRPNDLIVKQSDADLYTILRGALPEWKPQQWVYGIVNRDGLTDQQVQVYCQEMQKHHIYVRNVFDLDARNADGVLGAFEATLDDIVDNQAELDEILFKSRNDAANNLLKSIREFAEEKLNMFLQESRANSMDANVARERFNEEIWPLLRNKLNELKDFYEEQSRFKNPALEKCVRELADKKSDINFLLKPVNAIAVEIKSDQVGWFTSEMDRLRVALGKEIGKTGPELAELFDKLREQVREAFYSEGKLDTILPEVASLTGVEWLEELANKLLEVPTAKREVVLDIVHGIEAFKNATLSYEQLLEPRITQYGCLNLLNPNKDEGKGLINLFDPILAKKENKDGQTDEERYPGAIYTQETLHGAIQEVLEKVCKRLNESIDIDGIPCCILVEPSAALYSTIEKLYLILFSDKNSNRRWEEFYVEYRDEIWSGDQKRIPLSVLREWNIKVDTLIHALNNNSTQQE